MSFYCASTTTPVNWFETNQPDHEVDDPASDTVTFVCATNEKDMALQWQIWSFFTLSWHSFCKNALESSYNFNPIGITWRKIVCSVCLIPVSMAMWCLHTLWRFTVPAYNDGRTKSAPISRTNPSLPCYMIKIPMIASSPIVTLCTLIKLECGKLKL